MLMKLKRLLLLLCSVSLLGIGCDRVGGSSAVQAKEKASGSAPLVDESHLVAKVNRRAIAVEEFKRRVQALEEASRPKTQEEREQLLEQLVREELLIQDAVAMGLERDAEVKRRLEDLRRFVLVDAISKRLLETVDVGQKEVEEYYTQYQTAFKEPEQVRVRLIVTNTLVEGEAVRASAIQGADFAQLAKDRSIGAGKEQGRDVGWYMREVDRQLVRLTGGGHATDEKTLFPQVEPVAFALEVGQISQPIKGPDGYYLVKLEERKPARQKPLSEIRDQIHEGLLLQKRQQQIENRIAKLRQQGEVIVYKGRLGQ